MSVVIIGKSGATHHDDYFRFLLHFYPGARYLKGRFTQFVGYFTLQRLILLDFEYRSFKFFPLLLVRNLFFLKTDIYTVSIANWAPVRPKVGRQAILKWYLKTFVYKHLSKSNHTKIYYTSNMESISKYYSGTYVDFQYWDLAYLQQDAASHSLRDDVTSLDPVETLVYIGRWHKYRGAEFLYFLCNEYDQLPFKLLVWSGNITEDFLEIARGREDVTIVDQMPSSFDIINVHLHFKNILLYYPTSKRTSGYFGRGIQAGNYLYVSPAFFQDGQFVYPRISKFKTTNALFEAFEENKSKPFTPNTVCRYSNELNNGDAES